MATPYSEIYNMFLEQMTDTDLLDHTEKNRTQLLYGYMIRSCGAFSRLCDIDLSDRNEISKQFNSDLTESIKDIIVQGMIVEWLKPKYLYNENLNNVLNTKDYNMYSSANLLKEIRETYLTAKRDFESMMNKYSFINGNIENIVNN